MGLLQLTLLADGEPDKVCLYPVFFFDNGSCELEWLIIHASGRFTLQSEEHDLESLRSLVHQGVLCTSIAEEQDVHVVDLIYFEAHKVMPFVQEQEFLKELGDVIRELRGQPTSSDACREAYAAFRKDPSDRNRSRLKESYERVPKHLRCSLLHLDEKDIPIRKAIQEID